ncbi:hypothetical protein Taro_049295, partial [Colocasia esculenta]|nr:hypothetical protein [Colocasia esculenta]
MTGSGQFTPPPMVA